MVRKFFKDRDYRRWHRPAASQKMLKSLPDIPIRIGHSAEKWNVPTLTFACQGGSILFETVVPFVERLLR